MSVFYGRKKNKGVRFSRQKQHLLPEHTRIDEGKGMFPGFSCVEYSKACGSPLSLHLHKNQASVTNCQSVV